ncbi:CRISPR-associated protein (TIGR02584 family) [Neisseria sp. HSC-16F19]|nr:CRISPR-associated ring nuclease Csm6 [Neisseria sp. HSC-16F19]MCP2041858.1 CRISPR-associated protein (TIGR02584 family) [Neisseria sp. HSC-16F19]
MQNKKILVAVTGMSPQIVTETVYALYREQHWIPQEVHVLTTATGARNITTALLGADGFFRRLCNEYGLSDIAFDAEHIHIIRDARGENLADIRTPEENTLAANQIVRFIYDLCRDRNTELHVSIAGGRKSMGFYIGYALSLFGRRQDRLSHVLVEADFEQNPAFFYPPRQTALLKTPSGMRDAAQARVMLADIPFVRMGKGMPNLTLDDEWTFLDAVGMGQKQLTDFTLVLDCNTMSIRCGNVGPIKLAEREFSFYLSMAEFKREGKILHRRVGHGDYAVLKERYWQHYQTFKEDLQGHGSQARAHRDKLYQSLDMEDVFKEVPSRIKSLLKKHLGEAYARYYVIKSSGKRNDRRSELATLPENIDIIYRS